MINNKTIRLSTVNAIKANANIAASKVHDSKVTPHMFGNLPAVGVYITSSSAEGRDHMDPGFLRSLDINIEVAVSGNNASYANTMDDLIYEIKEALFSRSNWQDQFENVAGYNETVTLEEGGEQPIALGTLVITCELVELQ